MNTLIAALAGAAVALVLVALPLGWMCGRLRAGRNSVARKLADLTARHEAVKKENHRAWLRVQQLNIDLKHFKNLHFGPKQVGK